MKSNIKYMALLSVSLLIANPFAIIAAEVTDNKMSLPSEQKQSSEKKDDKKLDNKDDKDNKDKDKEEKKDDSEKDKAVEKKFEYNSKEYSDSKGRILGNYPEINGITELSERIYSDIEAKVAELNLDNYDSNIITFTVKDNIKPGFVEIYVKVESGYSSSEFKYYVDKLDNSWTDSESNYQEKIKNLEDKKAQEEKQKKDNDNKENEESKSIKPAEVTTEEKKPEKITMVPLRVNAEKLGWKVDWEQKTAVEPSKAILTKDKFMIKILVDPNTNYDLIINKDTTKTFIEPAKLDEPAELQDEVLYVPSTFIQKLSKFFKDENDLVEDKEKTEDKIVKPDAKDKDKKEENKTAAKTGKKDKDKTENKHVKPDTKDKEKSEDKTDSDESTKSE